MWLTRFETVVLEDALRRVRSQDDADILAGIVIKLTNSAAMKRYHLAEPALRALIWCEVERTKEPSFTSIVETVERLYLHAEDRRLERLIPRQVEAFESEFEWLLKNPVWIDFKSIGRQEIVNDSVDSLGTRLRSFTSGAVLPTTVEEQLRVN